MLQLLLNEQHSSFLFGRLKHCPNSKYLDRGSSRFLQPFQTIAVIVALFEAGKDIIILYPFQCILPYLSCYTGCFTTCGHYCRGWFPRSLWSKKFI